jgi:DMSO/TMAO reductase YedYZ heme-binding membrane subunit
MREDQREQPRNLVPYAAMAALLAVLISWSLYGYDDVGLRVSIRATARLAALVFSVAFAASPLNTLFRARWSRSLAAHRRSLGLAFAAIHFVHLGVVLLLATRFTASFLATTAMSSMVGGGVGYALIAAMVITSFKRTSKAIGATAWRRLHVTGMYVTWGIFVFSYLGRAFVYPLYAVLLSALVCSFSVRVASRVVSARRTRQRA